MARELSPNVIPVKEAVGGWLPVLPVADRDCDVALAACCVPLCVSARSCRFLLKRIPVLEMEVFFEETMMRRPQMVRFLKFRHRFLADLSRCFWNRAHLGKWSRQEKPLEMSCSGC